jgi:hypothetical protein
MNSEKYRFIKDEPAYSLVAAVCCTLLLLCTGCIESEEKDIWVPGELSFSISTSGGTILVGDPYKVTFTAIYPTNSVVDFPEVGREKDLVVLDRVWQEHPFTNGHTKTETVYTITSFRLGDHVICTNPVLYHHEGITETNRPPDTTISVVTSLEENESGELADIKPIHKLPGRIPDWIWITLLVAAAAFLIGLVTSKLWKHRRQLIPVAPPIPPHILAFHALEALQQKGLLEKDECNPFYTELSLILRTYLEGRFLLNAPDETTEEIIEALSKSPDLDEKQRKILQDFMRQADMVKFAKGHPDRRTMESAFATTQQFVEETKQSM